MKAKLELIETAAGLLLICRACSKRDAWVRDSTQSTTNFSIAVYDDTLLVVRCRRCKQVELFDL